MAVIGLGLDVVELPRARALLARHGERILARTLTAEERRYLDSLGDPAPAFAARLLLGEMADDLLLASQRVIPRKLLESGFTFEYPELEQAIRHVLESR